MSTLSKNCSKWREKLMSLEAMGKFDAFSGIFDLALYRQNASIWKEGSVSSHGHDSAEREDRAEGEGRNTPLILLAKLIWLLYRAARGAKRLILGNK